MNGFASLCLRRLPQTRTCGIPWTWESEHLGRERKEAFLITIFNSAGNHDGSLDTATDPLLRRDLPHGYIHNTRNQLVYLNPNYLHTYPPKVGARSPLKPSYSKQPNQFFFFFTEEPNNPCAPYGILLTSPLWLLLLLLLLSPS